MNCRVLAYHRVLDPERRSPIIECQRRRGMVVTPARFREEMLAVRGSHGPVTGAAFVAALHGAPLPQRACLVTFDDGYVDFADTAMPVLDALGIPAVLFVTRAQAVSPQRLAPVDRWYSIVGAWLDRCGHDPALASVAADLIAGARKREFVRSRPDKQDDILAALAVELGDAAPESAEAHYLGESDLRRLAARGVTLGVHGDDHVRLTSLTRAVRRRSLADCRVWLQSLTGEVPALLSYPDGAFDEEVMADVREAGFLSAFTIGRQAIVGEETRYCVNREFIPGGEPNVPAGHS